MRRSETVPPGPRDTAGREPVFEQPWQAQLFALVVVLQDGGVFTAAEWVQALGRERKRPDVVADGSDYYLSMLDALEGMLAGKGLSDAGEIASVAAAWRRAARATPHGQPILLENDPQGFVAG